jgi:hypothetical protein
MDFTDVTEIGLVACESHAEVNRLCAAAQSEDRLRRGAIDNGPPIGYTAFLADPDPHKRAILRERKPHLPHCKARWPIAMAPSHRNQARQQSS